MPAFPNSPERRNRRHGDSLERILERHEHQLANLVAPGHPLTPERMRGRVPEAAQLIAHATEAGIDWPTRESAVSPRLGSTIRQYFIPDAAQADAHFVYEANHGRRGIGKYRGFNNFPAILRAVPYKPTGREDFQAAMHRNPSGALYGSKPYLLRAYLLAPEFMGSLQQAVDTCGGSSEWNDALMRGGLEADLYPEDAALVRGSRLAYGLLANLIRADDLQRQTEWLGLEGKTPPITDPETELWT